MVEQLENLRNSINPIAKNFCRALAFGGSLFLADPSLAPAAPTPEASSSKIAVQGKTLIDSVTGRNFTVRSNQFVILGYQGDNPYISTFHPARYSRSAVQDSLAQMHLLGYNTTRLVFNSYSDGEYGSAQVCKEGQSYQFDLCINPASMNNLADTINLARQNELKVILSFVAWPDNYFTNPPSQYSNSENIIFLDPQTVRDMGRYYKDFFTSLKSKSVDFSTFLAIDPIAEPALDSALYPLNQTGLVMDSNKFNISPGQTFTVSNALNAKTDGQSSPQMNQLLGQAMTLSFNSWYQQIKSVDPSLLTLYDQFQAYAVRDPADTRHVDDSELINPNLKADILAVEPYPHFLASLTDNISTFFKGDPNFPSQLINFPKPVIAIEFGLERAVNTLLQQQNPDGDLAFLTYWQNQMCQLGLVGWDLFLWTPANSPLLSGPNGFISAVENNNRLAYNLSPQVRPNLCGKPISTAGVFRPPTGQWFFRNSNLAGMADLAPFVYNPVPGGTPVIGDWTGKGYKSVGEFKDGLWYLKNSNSAGNPDLQFYFGAPGDLPVVGDWDGNGTDTVGVYRNGGFYLRNSNSTGFADLSFTLGIPGDKPIAGKWNGGNISTVGVFRPGSGAIFLKNQNTTGFADTVITYGIPGDIPVAGDWDGNGTETMGVYRNGTFFLKNSNTTGFADMSFAFGTSSDIPLAGNWLGANVPDWLGINAPVGIARPPATRAALGGSSRLTIPHILIPLPTPSPTPTSIPTIAPRPAPR